MHAIYTPGLHQFLLQVTFKAWMANGKLMQSRRISKDNTGNIHSTDTPSLPGKNFASWDKAKQAYFYDRQHFWNAFVKIIDGKSLGDLTEVFLCFVWLSYHVLRDCNENRHTFRINQSKFSKEWRAIWMLVCFKAHTHTHTHIHTHKQTHTPTHTHTHTQNLRGVYI